MFDLIVRLWIVFVRAIFLRSPRSLVPCAPAAVVVDRLLEITGGNMAIAQALLPRSARAEAAAVYAACRALDGNEDLAHDPEAAMRGIRETASYLAHERPDPPNADALVPYDARSAGDVRCTRHLPDIRAQLDHLPAAFRQRAVAFVRDIARRMEHARTEGMSREAYGTFVMGRAVEYALEVLRVDPRSGALREALGRVLIAANDLRDCNVDARRLGTESVEGLAIEALQLRVLPDLPLVTELLRGLRFERWSGARGAVARMAVTTGASLLRGLGRPARGFLAWPLVSALACAVSERLYTRMIEHIEGEFWGAFAARANVVVRSAEEHSALRRFERSVAGRLSQPEPYVAALDLCARAVALLRSCSLDVPLHKLSQPTCHAVLAADYLLFEATRHVARAGGEALADLGAFACQLTARVRDGSADETELTAFLARRLGGEVGITGEELDAFEQAHVCLAAALRAYSAEEKLGPTDPIELDPRFSRAQWWGERLGLVARTHLESATAAVVALTTSRARRALAHTQDFLRRALGLRHGADMFPLAHIVAYYGLFIAAVLDAPAHAAAWLADLLGAPHALGVITLCLRGAMFVPHALLALSLTIGVMHMIAHRKMFVHWAANAALEFLLCVPAVLTYPEMWMFHVVNHHGRNDGEGDHGSTRGAEHGWRAVRYWVLYSARVKYHTACDLLAWRKEPTRRRMARRLLLRFFLESSAVVAFVWVLTFLRPVVMLWAWWLPFVFTVLSGGFFAWVTHAPASPGKTINHTSRALNVAIHNQGWHQIHHRYPNIHWTEIPSKVDVTLALDPAEGLLVPHWPTILSAWRIFTPNGFRDPEHSERQMQRLKEASAGGRLRRRWFWFFGDVG